MPNSRVSRLADPGGGHVNLGTFFIEKLIIHDVPRHAPGVTADQIVFSEVESDLDAGLKNFFRERVIRSLNRQGYEIERDPDSSSPVPERATDILADADALVPASQEVARHLFAAQTGVNPAGLVVIATGTVDDAACLAILKLEREDAIRVHQQQLDGHTTFDVRHLQDLMLGKNTRLFKASVLICPGTGDVTTIEGLASDDQRGYDPTTEVANFFLGTFLGCRLKTAPDTATKRFFEATQDWVDLKVTEPEKKARYEVALLQQMNATTTQITPNTFATTNLDTDDRQSFRDHLAEKDAPTTQFDKDLRLIASRVRQMSMEFMESSLRLSGSAEDIDEYVQVNESETDAAPVEIHDRVKRVRGGR